MANGKFEGVFEIERFEELVAQYGAAEWSDGINDTSHPDTERKRKELVDYVRGAVLELYLRSRK